MSTSSNTKVPRIPELVGATGPFELTGSRTKVDLPMQEPSGPASRMVEGLADWEPRRVFLNMEKMVGPNGGPPFYVYLNAPPNEDWERHPDLFAGDLPMFGLRESSIADEYRTPDGLYTQLDITKLFVRLPLLDNWDPRNLHITFVPKYPGNFPSIRVGRAALYFA